MATDVREGQNSSHRIIFAAFVDDLVSDFILVVTEKEEVNRTKTFL